MPKQLQNFDISANVNVEHVHACTQCTDACTDVNVEHIHA